MTVITSRSCCLVDTRHEGAISDDQADGGKDAEETTITKISRLPLAGANC